MEKRKHYLDNIRWITLCFVIIYHIFYIFNSSGVVSNIGVTGISTDLQLGISSLRGIINK